MLSGSTACAQEPPPTPRALPEAEGQAPADGVTLHYRLYGESKRGLPLLVLNGGPGLSSEHYGGLAERLARLGDGRQAIAFDQRGTGRSPLDRVDASTVSLEATVEDIEALREHLGIEAWVVFGHSWGGMYAMTYAVAYPDRVRGLILSASGGSDLSWTSSFQDDLRARLNAEQREAYGQATTRQARVEAMAPAYVFDDANVPFVVAALSNPKASNPAVRTLVFQDLFRVEFDLADDLARFESPALVLHGRDDILGPEVPLRTHAALPNSDLVLLDECGHYLWLDRPDAYSDAIETFLGGLTA